MSNHVTIAGAGTGKTTYLVEQALNIKHKKILIVTYTKVNEREIYNKIISKKGYIPENITIQTWFSFLIQQGVKPYKMDMFEDLYDKKIRGMIFLNKQSGLKYTGKKGHSVYYKDTELPCYFNKNLQIYSDKISKFIFKCNKKNKGLIFKRLEKIYSYIFVDEFQDLAGYDLELIKLLFKSNINIELVGDPRQVVYSTHTSKKHNQYKYSNIIKFVEKELKNLDCVIDDDKLMKSHRNNKEICNYANNLYPEFTPIKECECEVCRKLNKENLGVIILRSDEEINNYLITYNPVQLSDNKNNPNINMNYRHMNFGESKGLTFDRVIIYPTEPIKKWIFDNNTDLKDQSKAKFYVAITRARHSVAIYIP